MHRWSFLLSHTIVRLITWYHMSGSLFLRRRHHMLLHKFRWKMHRVRVTLKAFHYMKGEKYARTRQNASLNYHHSPFRSHLHYCSRKPLSLREICMCSSLHTRQFIYIWKDWGNCSSWLSFPLSMGWWTNASVAHWNAPFICLGPCALSVMCFTLMGLTLSRLFNSAFALFYSINHCHQSSFFMSL